jgi:hypothetical protein
MDLLEINYQRKNEKQRKKLNELDFSYHYQI